MFIFQTPEAVRADVRAVRARVAAARQFVCDAAVFVGLGAAFGAALFLRGRAQGSGDAAPAQKKKVPSC